MTESDKACTDPTCGNCQRVDSEVVTDTHVHIVTYVGDYAVTTIVSPELRDPMVSSLQMLGIIKIPVLTMMVGFVGPYSVQDSKETVPDDEFVRFISRHSNMADPWGPHDMLVDEVRAGTLDLDTPVPVEEMQAQSRGYFKEALDRFKAEGIGEWNF